MLTFKQSVLLLVSIVTILAIIALGTGLSPLYWPLPRNSAKENHSAVVVTTKTTTLKTSMTTRLKPIPKKYNQLTTVQLVTALPTTTHIITIINATSIQNISNL